MLVPVPASVELRADGTPPTRLLSRLLACRLFARSKTLWQACRLGRGHACIFHLCYAYQSRPMFSV